MTEEHWIDYVSYVAANEVLDKIGKKAWGPRSMVEMIVRTVRLMEQEKGMLDE